MFRLPDEQECLRMLEQAGCSPEVIEHCLFVKVLALKIAARCGADTELVRTGALLHDIGRSRTHGITHAVEGATIARNLGLPDAIVLIIERHIGAGIGREEAVKVGLPAKDYIPISLEEKIICHADNLVASNRRQRLCTLVSKWREKGLDEPARRVEILHSELSGLCGIDLDDIE